jgi:DNA polymerase I
MKKIGKPNTFTLEDYAINISLQRNIKDYTVIPQHVKAAMKYIEYQTQIARKNNAADAEIKAIQNSIQKGDVIKFIKTKGQEGAKAFEIAKLQDIDPKKYKELLRSAFEQVLDALGITYEEIKGIKKMDAFF